MIALALKATVALLAAFLATAALRHARASVRHLVLAATFAFLLLLPAVQTLAPRVAIELDPSAPVVRAAAAALPVLPANAAAQPVAKPAASRFAIDWLALYATVSMLMLVRLAAGVIRLRRLARRGEVWLGGTARMNEVARQADIRRPALVVLSDGIASPLTFGFRRSTIVLPADAAHWAEDALDRALRHELEHVRREDWMLQLVARAALAVYWIHPLAWVAWRRFSLEAERACDDAVIESCAAPDRYAAQLVSLAHDVRGTTMMPALNMAGRSRLSERVTAILDPTIRRGPRGGAAVVATACVVVALLFSLAPARFVSAAGRSVASLRTESYGALMAEVFVKAAGENDVEEVTRLLRDGMDVDTISPGDGTALLCAARAGQTGMMRLLLERGADVNLASRGDGNPLIAAAHAGQLEAVRLLLDHGARIDEIVPADENALIQAAGEGHADVVRLLIERGADVNAQALADGRELRTPLSMARRGGFKEIERTLVRAGARR